MSVYDTVVRVRSRYGPTPTVEECCAIVNETAWWHRDEGLGVSGKSSGTNGPQPRTGTRIALDVVQDGKTLEAWDVLIAAGGAPPEYSASKPSATPCWSYLGSITDASRPWVAPVAPTTTQPPPDPDPEPDPGPVEPVVDYDTFVLHEAPEVATTFAAQHHVPPAASDLYHNAWRRLVEAWTHRDILLDIQGKPLQDGGAGGAK